LLYELAPGQSPSYGTIYGRDVAVNSKLDLCRRQEDLTQAWSLVELWFLTYGRVGAVALVALALGYLALHRLLEGPILWPLAIIVGFGLLSLCVGLLAWLHEFGATAITLVAVIAVSLATISWQRNSRVSRPSLIRSGDRLTVSLSVLTLGGFLLVLSVLTIYPMTAFDATMYHLPLARDLVQNQGFQYDPFVRYSFFPQGNEAVFAFAMLLSPDPAVSAGLELAMLTATVALVFVWFLTSGRSAAGALIAALLVLASPIVVIPGTSPYVDVWVMACLTAGLIVGLLILDDHLPWNWASFGLAGFLIGQAAATKYTGVLFGAAVILGLVVAARGSRILWPHIVSAVAGFAVAAAPWYAWTLYITGDPFYPFGTELFGNRPGLWTAAEIAYQKVAAHDAPTAGLAGILRQDVLYLLGRAPIEVVGGLPPLNPLAGLGLLALAVRRWWSMRPLVATMVATILSLGIWVSSTSDPRYLLPALGVMAIGGGLVVEASHRRLREVLTQRMSWLARPRSGLVLVPLATIIILSASSIEVASVLHSQGLPPTTESTVRAYLVNHVGCYGGLAYLNDRLGSSYTAYGWGCESANFYASGKYMGDWFGPAGYFRVFDGMSNPPVQTALLATRLRALGVTYLLVPNGLGVDPETMTADGHFSLVSSSDGTNVFQLLDANGPQPSAVGPALNPRPVVVRAPRKAESLALWDPRALATSHQRPPLERLDHEQRRAE